MNKSVTEVFVEQPQASPGSAKDHQPASNFEEKKILHTGDTESLESQNRRKQTESDKKNMSGVICLVSCVTWSSLETKSARCSWPMQQKYIVFIDKLIGTK